MKFPRIIYVCVFVLCFAFFTFGTHAADEMDMSKVRKVIKENNLKFREAVQKGDVSAILDQFTDDGMSLPPNMKIVKGMEKLKAHWNMAFEMGMKDIEYTTKEIFGSGDYVIEIGMYTVKFQPKDGNPFQDEGKYVVVWEKTDKGGLKGFLRIWNTSLPPM